MGCVQKLVILGDDYSGRAEVTEKGEIRVKKGTLISNISSNGLPQMIAKLRLNVTEIQGGTPCLDKDYIFNNLNDACLFVTGRNLNHENVFFPDSDGIAPLLSKAGEGVTDTEGSLVSLSLEKPERNPRLRELCIENFGYKCQICGFDFETVYGPRFKGLIHVHHLTPISKYNGNHSVDPTKDLIPVCPNCHQALHSKPGDEPYTPDELRTYLKRKE